MIIYTVNTLKIKSFFPLELFRVSKIVTCIANLENKIYFLNLFNYGVVFFWVTVWEVLV